jgi:AAA family ATP:ADP antiporter
MQMTDSDHGMQDPTPRGPFNAVLSVFNLSRSELPSALLAAFMFFCLLCGYFFVRPVREAFGVERGMSALYSLFIATMVVSLALNPVFSWLVGRFDRRVFLPISYGSIMLMLLGFAFYRAAGGEQEVAVWTGKVFFVWLSVVNLFMTGLFWSLMADCFGPADARRIFPFVAVGGTLGALLGSAAAWAFSGYPFILFNVDLFDIGITLTPPRMMIVAAGFIACAGGISIVLSLIRPPIGRPAHAPPRRRAFSEAIDGLRLAARSPYILSIGAYIGLLAVVVTLLYFTQNRLVLAAESSESNRVGAFASIDFWTQVATLTLQLALTARLMRWIGVGWTLALLPLVVLAGFAMLAFGEGAGWSAAAMLVAVTVVQAVFRAVKYAVARPARESLFTVVSRDEKYKAKSLIDTFVYRAGDTAGAGVDAWLTAITVATMTALAATVAPIAIVMGGLALYLGAARNRRAGI